LRSELDRERQLHVARLDENANCLQESEKRTKMLQRDLKAQRCTVRELKVRPRWISIQFWCPVIVAPLYIITQDKLTENKVFQLKQKDWYENELRKYLTMAKDFDIARSRKV